MNQVTLIGRVGKDAETIDFGTGKKTSFPLATSRKYKNAAGELKKETQWHNIATFGKVAETAEKWVKKGMQLAVSGSIVYREWEKDGKKYYATDIKCEHMEMLGSPASSQQASQQPEQQKQEDVFAQVEKEDDLPF